MNFWKIIVDIALLIADIAFRLVGIRLTIYFWHRSIKSFQSRKWLATQGEITGFSIVEGTHGYASAIGHYEPHLSYKYMIGDTEYNSNRVSYRFLGSKYLDRDKFSSRSEAIDFVLTHHPTSQEVKVFYNPKNSKESVLEPGASWPDFFFLGLFCNYATTQMIFGGIAILSWNRS